MAIPEQLDLMRQEVSALLASPAFERSKANRELLSYLFDKAAAGHEDGISEYMIAQDLLRRDEGFDPSVDPIVRVRMRRLREAMTTFYLENPDRRARLTLPRGSYTLSVSQKVPETSPPDHAAAETAIHRDGAPDSGYSEGGEVPDHRRKRQSSLWKYIAAMSALLILALLAALMGGMWHPFGAKPADVAEGTHSYPILAIAPFDNLTDETIKDFSEKSVPRQIAGDIQRFGRADVRVLASNLKQEAQGADFVLRGTILSLDGTVDIALVLTDTQSGEAIMTTRITRNDRGGDYATVLQEISRTVSGRLVSQSGILSKLVQASLASDSASNPAGQDRFGLYRCVVLTDAFLTSYAPEQFLAAYRCFEGAREMLETDPVGRATFGTLMMHAVPEYHLMDVSGLPETMLARADEVFDYAELLADQYPYLDVSYVLLGAMHNVRGETDLAIQNLDAAVKLNPSNPISYGVLAYANMSADLHNEAREAAATAIRLSDDPAPYLYLPILMSGLVHKNARLVDMARGHYQKQQRPERDIVLLAAAAMIGDTAEVDRLLHKLGRPEDPLADLRPLLRGTIARETVENLLESVGLDVPDPTCLSSASGNVSRQMDCAE